MSLIPTTCAVARSPPKEWWRGHCVTTPNSLKNAIFFTFHQQIANCFNLSPYSSENPSCKHSFTPQCVDIVWRLLVFAAVEDDGAAPGASLLSLMPRFLNTGPGPPCFIPSSLSADRRRRICFTSDGGQFLLLNTPLKRVGVSGAYFQGLEVSGGGGREGEGGG